jgi:hypothetical protein
MPSERIQRRIDSLLDQADEAIEAGDWERARQRAEDALALDPESSDAVSIRDAAARRLSDGSPRVSPDASLQPVPTLPASFAGGRYEVRDHLGDGATKRVFLAHDARLDRDVALALVRTEGLDETGRERVRREARAMGRVGAHPHHVAVFDSDEEDGQPFVVMEYMAGGSVAQAIAAAEEHRLPEAQTLEIARRRARTTSTASSTAGCGSCSPTRRWAARSPRWLSPTSG